MLLSSGLYGIGQREFEFRPAVDSDHGARIAALAVGPEELDRQIDRWMDGRTDGWVGGWVRG